MAKPRVNPAPSNDPLLAGLNPPQMEAVVNVDGPMLVLAGAGSGKTRVITHRIARLIASRRCAPWNVLAVTFTNKAAGEMRERIASLLDSSLRGFWIGTFHSVCARILRMDGEALGIDPRFTIYDRSDSLAVVKQALKDIELDIEAKKAPGILNAISRYKNRFEFPEQAIEHARDEYEWKSAKAYAKYNELLGQNNALDFDDLLVEAVRLFHEKADVLDVYRKRFLYILVDEYQDTNHPQYLLLRALAGGHNNICVVGDDDQSIYRWRGADIGNILNFQKDYPNARVVRLEQNYRSTRSIIDAAFHVIQHNEGRHPKRMWTEGEDGAKIVIHTASDETAEAKWVLDIIGQLRGEAGADYRDAAVFYRVNAQSRAFEEECVRRGVPYRVVGTTAFYQRKEIKDLMAYCHLLVNPSDSVAFARVVNEPKRKLGARSVEILLEFAAAWRMPVLEAALLAREEGELRSSLPTAAANGFHKFAKMYGHWRKTFEKASLDTMIERIAADSGYWDMLEQSKDPQDQTRLENLQELINAGAEFEHNLEIGDDGDEYPRGLPLMEAFLEKSSLVSDLDALEEGENALVLMTLHGAKGLEFPYVFLTGMEEGLLPHMQSLDTKAALEEERRLCYVGITRAKKRVYCTNAAARRLYNRSDYTVPSRFLDEIPDEFKEVTTWLDGDDCEEGYDEPAAPAGKRRKREETFAEGDMVNHRSFGFGVVTEVEGEGAKAHITVDFQQIGKKTLVQEYARMTKV